MKSKWYFSVVILILALLGVNLDHGVTPNQEIVVEFNNEVSSQESLQAIALVKEQLEAIGVDNIKVVASSKGNLKITYYSAIDVAGIQQLFSTTSGLGTLSFSHEGEPIQLPNEDEVYGFQLNVSEIQTGTDADLDVDGFVLEFKSVHDRYSAPDVYATFPSGALRDLNTLENVAYSVHRYNALLIDATSYAIPEVRAGPLA